MNFDSFLSLVEQIAATIDRKVTGSRAAAIRPSPQGNEHNLYRSEGQLVHMQELQTLTDHGHGQTSLHERFVREVNQHDFRNTDNIDSSIYNVSSSVSSFQHEAYSNAYEAYAADQRRRTAPTVNKQVWDSFTEEDKKCWGGISPDGRYKIWECFKERALQSTSATSGNATTNVVPRHATGNGTQSANTNETLPSPTAGATTPYGSRIAGEHRLSPKPTVSWKPSATNDSILIHNTRSSSSDAEARIKSLLDERPIGSRPPGSITPADFTADKPEHNTFRSHDNLQNANLSIFEHNITYNNLTVKSDLINSLLAISLSLKVFLSLRAGSLLDSLQ